MSTGKKRPKNGTPNQMTIPLFEAPAAEPAEHWATATLSDIAEVRLGRQRSPKRAQGEHMRPYMRAANVTWDGISLHDVKEMDFTPKEFETYELRNGDLLLSEASGSASEVGKPAVWRNEVPGACFQNTLIRVRAPEELVSFLLLHFTKDAVTGLFAQASRGVGIHHLGAKSLSDWQVTVPPLAEQQRIVEAIESYFTRLDDAVATLQRVERNLKRYRASVLKSAVEGRLVPTEAELAKQEGRDYEPADVLLSRILKERRHRWEQAELAKMQAKGKPPTNDKWKAKYQEPAAPDTTNLPDIPEGWCWAGPDQITSGVDYALSIGPFGSNLKVPDYRDEGVPLVFVRNIRSESFGLDGDKFVTEEKANELRAHWVEPGDILVTKMGDPPGDACIYPKNRPVGIVTADCIRFQPYPSLDSRLLLSAIRSPLVQQQILNVTKGVAQLKVSLARFKTVAIPLAPLAEQKRIADEVERLRAVAEAAEAEVSRMLVRSVRLRQAILKWAFEGKLADQDPNDEPASVLLERIKAEREAAAPTKKDTAGRRKRGGKKVLKEKTA